MIVIFVDVDVQTVCRPHNSICEDDTRYCILAYVEVN